jgi:hypothetical protein
MKHDELGDMGHLVHTKKDYEHMPHFLKITYNYRAILNLQSQSH